MPECAFTLDCKHCPICYYASHTECCYCRTKWGVPKPEDDSCEDDGSEENQD